MENLTALKGPDAQKNAATKSAPLNPAAFDKWERHIAGALGLTLDEIRELRVQHLQVKVHWITHKRRVMYSPLGVAAIKARIEQAALPDSPPTAPGTNAGVPDASKDVAEKNAALEIITLKVFRNGLKHHQIIEAHFPDKDPADARNRVRVRVRSDKNFTKGMEIPVTFLQEGLYLLARACPRSKGRW